MRKVRLFDVNLRKLYCEVFSIFSTFLGIFAFIIDNNVFKENVFCLVSFVFIFLIVIYFILWIWVSKWKSININIENTTISIITGDIFKQDGLKVIAFNEYFDTQVDDTIISKQSLNGIFIKERVFNVDKLNKHIETYPFNKEDILDENTNRIFGKTKRYKIGTVCLYNDYILTAFSKFNERNQAYLTMPEYLGFLIKFWDEINVVYSQKSVSVPIFGSGITRIREHKNITDEELLKIMLWTFKISETRFKYPAKLTIVIHPEKIDQINLFEIKSMQNGI
ncbi:macro domain-containing protein [Gallibacterium melopsittaci]|uniref:Macro domain-containing protein n=1 Tax=Gallibacterium melopsittaci TaxID=516063 RepID=A0ABV6I0L0_9PAST